MKNECLFRPFKLSSGKIRPVRPSLGVSSAGIVEKDTQRVDGGGATMSRIPRATLSSRDAQFCTQTNC